MYAGLCGFGMELRKAFPKDGHVGSVDLFCPEERIWKDNVKDYLGTPDAQGDVAYSAIRRTFEYEDFTWVNRSKNPFYRSRYRIGLQSMARYVGMCARTLCNHLSSIHHFILCGCG